MALGTSYGQTVGGPIREDVLDLIFQITPEDTPFFNLIGDADASNVVHQWPIRSLTTRQDNAVQEGEEFAGNFQDLILPTRVTNLTQILRKLPRVTETMQAVNTIGISDLMADQISQRAVEWKTDVEHALLRGSLVSGTSADGTARRMNGFHNAIANNRFDYQTTGTFGEQTFNNLMEEIWNDGGRAQDVLVNARLKRTISTFTDSATKFFMAEDRRVTNTIGVYESDFHVTNIHLSRDIPQVITAGQTGLFTLFALDRSFFAKAWLRTPVIERLPKTGDAETAVVIGECTLEFGNEDAAGILEAIQDSGLLGGV